MIPIKGLKNLPKKLKYPSIPFNNFIESELRPVGFARPQRYLLSSLHPWQTPLMATRLRFATPQSIIMTTILITCWLMIIIIIIIIYWYDNNKQRRVIELLEIFPIKKEAGVTEWEIMLSGKSSCVNL